METDPTEAYTRLRRAVFSDAKQARRELSAVRQEAADLFDAVLGLAGRPGEGRVRQLIATAARIDGFAAAIEPTLRRWLAAESDEFARSAIVAALATDPLPGRQPTRDSLPLEFVEAYRLVTDRLCHKVRNALPAPVAAVVTLERLSESVADPALAAELRDVVSLLKPSIQRLTRVTEYDSADAVMRWASIAVGPWLEAAVPQLKSQCGAAELCLVATDQCRGLCVRATPFWLDTIFSNLWLNAVQAVQAVAAGPCVITVEVNAVGSQLHLLIRDNGPGFTTQQVGTIFRNPYSTKGENRGRGLLEVADAVRQLHGEVRLLPVAANQHRVQIRLPLDPS